MTLQMRIPLCIIFFWLHSQDVTGQANTSLSNLVSPTNINQVLTPNATNTLDVGTGARNWRNIYLGSAYYLKNLRIIHAPGATNFFAGQSAGNPATTGTNNTGFGLSSLAVVTTGANNTALGFNALKATTLGGRNTGLGFEALLKNTGGGYNTAVGERVLYSNILGLANTAVGSAALFSNTNGKNNTAAGVNALYLNTVGYSNVAIGAAALYANQTGFNLVAMGDSALLKNTASSNIAIGSKALFENTTGYNNVATGFQALYSNTSGRFNDASGYQSLYFNISGSYNTAAGVFALYSNQTASYNSAFGYNALYSSTSAFYNSAFGSLALNATTTGGYNTAVGRRALEANTTGTFNTAIGYDAGPTIATLTNTTAVGNGARPLVSNQIWLGNASVTSIRASSGFIIMSDGRFKKDLNENVPGLDFIKLLKPVTYTYDIKGLNKKMSGDGNTKRTDSYGETPDPMTAQKEAIDLKEKISYTGLIAQDVEKAAKQLKYEFSGVYHPQNEQDVYGLSYSDFVMPLIKSVQELSSENDSLKQDNINLREENRLIMDRLNKIEKMLKITSSSSGNMTSAKLGQNSPNPFAITTTIPYTLPEGTVTSAQIMLFDATGKRIRLFNLKPDGGGNIAIPGSTLASGTYTYSLYVNGALTESKKLVLLK